MSPTASVRLLCRWFGPNLLTMSGLYRHLGESGTFSCRTTVSGGSLGGQNPRPRQVEAGSAVALALHELRLVNEAFDGAEEKGYGFVAPDEDGDDLFVHYSSIEGGGFRSLEEGERVSYEPARGRKGEEAHTLRRVE